MTKKGQNKKVVGKIFMLVLTISMLLSSFAGSASACVMQPEGTNVPPLVILVNFTGTLRARIIVRNLQTFGAQRGRHCGCGLGWRRAFNSASRSVNAINGLEPIDTARAVFTGTNDPVGGMSFVKNTNTTTYLAGASQGNDWQGFSAVVDDTFVSGSPVDLIFEATVTEGTTIEEIAAELQASAVAGGEVDANGVPIADGEHPMAINTVEGSITPFEPTSVSFAQSQVTTKTAIATIVGLVALAGMSVSTFALRRKEQA